MDDTPTTHVELARPLDELRERPDTIRDAIERAARIDTMRDWLGELRDNLRNGYVDATARVIEETTGGSFNAPSKGVGTAYRTQPQPTPRVDDAEAFGEWYVGTLLGRDGGEQPREHLVRFDDHVARRLVAECDSADLLAFLDVRADQGDRAACALLADVISVDVEWLGCEGALEALIKGDAHTLDDGRPRVVVNPSALTCVDRATGERVPGVDVTPARPGVLTIKPDTAFKKRLRGELDELLGPPALRE